MKRIKKISLCLIALCSVGLFQLDTSFLHAANFEGNEDEWLTRCSYGQETEAQAQQCREFKEYYAGLTDSLEAQASSLDKRIAKIQDNIDDITGAMKDLDSLIDKLEKNIELNEANIRTIQKEITSLNTKIEQKQKDIDERNELIVSRMLDEQANNGTNMEVDVLMGSKDLVDMIRKMEGFRRITESDQTEIEKLMEDKKELNLQKSEQTRLKEDAEEKKAENEKNKKEAEDAKAQQNKLLKEYRKKEADLIEEMRSVEVDIATIQNNIININTSVANNIDFSGNGSLVNPVPGGSMSAGTWYYPGGGVHLGMDMAAPIGTQLVAPADGIILYANNPAPTNGGYLGNWTGYPAGAGNSILLLTQVDGITYAISFAHLSQEGFAVSAGSQVKKGQVLALTGNSGNSSGPHCHIEVINLGKMSVASAISQFRSTADFAYGTGWGSSALSKTCSASGPPCRERPETIFG